MRKGVRFLIMVLTVCLLGTAVYLVKGDTKPVTTSAKHKSLSSQQKVADFEYMYKILQENFPYFAIEKQKTGFDWLSHHDQFVREIAATKDDKEFFYTLFKIVNLLQNAHTQVLLPPQVTYFKGVYLTIGRNSWYSVLNSSQVDTSDYWQSIASSLDIHVLASFQYVGGKYVAEDYKGLESAKQGIPEGSILLKINGNEPDDYVKSLTDKMYLNYDFLRKKLMVDNLPIFSDQSHSVTLTVQTPNGTIITQKLSDIGKRIQQAQQTISTLKTEVLKQNKVAYLKIPAMTVEPKPQETEQIKQFLQQVRKYPYLIIDIRGNEGGNSQYWVQNLVEPLTSKNLKQENYVLFRGGSYINPFLTEFYPQVQPVNLMPQSVVLQQSNIKNFTTFARTTLEVLPANNLGFHGHIFVLVDDNVYSSAEAFASFAKSTKWATLVGTTTGGDGIGTDPAVAVLPNSGLVFRFPLDMGLNPDGIANEAAHTKPDIYVEQSYPDYLKNFSWQKEHLNELISPYDTVLNETLRMCN